MGRKRRDESHGLRAGWRKRWSRPSAAMDVEPLLGLDEALAALGRCPHHPRGLVRREVATVPVESIVGTLARGEDFDRLFRPLNPSLRNRRERLARAGAAGLSPVSLVRVGELYFVEDGHHRISLARARDQLAVDALVRSVCTVAFACACLTQNDLQVKAAERRFLECVPLPDPDLRDVWLDDPAGYEVLVAAARRWSAQHSDTAVAEDEGDLDPAVAAAWWRRHVVPLAHRAGCDGAGSIAPAYLCIHESPLQYVTLSVDRGLQERESAVERGFSGAAAADTGDRPRRFTSGSGSLRDTVDSQSSSINESTRSGPSCMTLWVVSQLWTTNCSSPRTRAVNAAIGDSPGQSVAST